MMVRCKMQNMISKDCILARRFDTAQAVRLTLADTSIFKVEDVDSAPENVWIAPALFDPQINGFAGVDFQREGLTLEELSTAANGLRAAGCGQFFFTLTTDEWPVLLARLKHARALRAQSTELQSAIAGWHIEGPFLSAEPGYHGAHDPKLMLNPTAERIRELRAAAGDDPLLITVAPERDGAIEAIELAASLKIAVSLGHTDASAATLAAAVKAGATGFTHLGNGCTQALDRHDNIILRVLETPGLCASVIPDAIHVSPAMFRLIHARTDRPDDSATVCYTTDAMSAAGAPPGRYRLGKIELEVGADRVVRMPGRTNFAGSALRPVDGVFMAAKMLNCTWQDAWKCASLATRRYAGLSVKQQGMPFCVLTVDGNEFKSGQLYADGKKTEILKS